MSKGGSGRSHSSPCLRPWIHKPNYMKDLSKAHWTSYSWIGHEGANIVHFQFIRRYNSALSLIVWHRTHGMTLTCHGGRQAYCSSYPAKKSQLLTNWMFLHIQHQLWTFLIFNLYFIYSFWCCMYHYYYYFGIIHQVVVLNVAVGFLVLGSMNLSFQSNSNCVMISSKIIHKPDKCHGIYVMALRR